MEYYEEFQACLDKNDYKHFLTLWEEYCTSEEVDGEEIRSILDSIRNSTFAQQFGQYVETALSLWKQIEDKDLAHDVFRLILDLQTTDSPSLAEITLTYLKARYGEQKHFNEKIRLIGLRNRKNFQGAVRNYELLTHMNRGNFVYHTGGWGTGEIIELSLVREQLVLEFEYVVGKKDLPFENAFKNLIPLDDSHFLAKRFGNPDQLEKEARKDPVGVVRKLLKDLGPKTALEIKEELCELVIPTSDWSKWWQTARGKIKKDTRIETPSSIREPFRLRDTEISHEERYQQAIENANEMSHFLSTTHNYLRDFPEILKKDEFKDFLKQKLLEKLSLEEISQSHKIQILTLLQIIFPEEAKNYSIDDLVAQLDNVAETVEKIETSSHKKALLTAVKRLRDDWKEIFADLFLTVHHNVLREFLLKELSSTKALTFFEAELQRLVHAPSKYPEAFLWYFQKVMNKESVPFGRDKEMQCKFFESFLVLFSELERDAAQRDLVKKIYNSISGNRYALVRKILEGSSEHFAREFLLLVTKCRTLTDHDITILHSLVKVVHPSLAKPADEQEKEREEEDILWTTQDAYNRVNEKVRHLATVATVENAKEIEEARALGDLRENSEFKFALEKRSQLQAQLKLLTDQLNRARILTKHDIRTHEAGIGTVIEIEDSKGKNHTYTLLGPWEADTDKNILSIQSKFAQAATGHTVGDSFSFQGESYTLKSISSFL